MATGMAGTQGGQHGVGQFGHIGHIAGAQTGRGAIGRNSTTGRTTSLMSSHMIDRMTQFIGSEVVAVKAMVGTYFVDVPATDTGIALLQFANGVHATLQHCGHRIGRVREGLGHRLVGEILLVGVEGRLDVQTAAEDERLAVLLEEVGPDGLHEPGVLVGDRVGNRRGDELRRM